VRQNSRGKYDFYIRNPVKQADNLLYRWLSVMLKPRSIASFDNWPLADNFYLFQCRKPRPLGVVRVQRLCRL